MDNRGTKKTSELQRLDLVQNFNSGQILMVSEVKGEGRDKTFTLTDGEKRVERTYQQVRDNWMFHS